MLEKLALSTSAKAWTGSISAAAFAEYAKPTIDYVLGIVMDKLEAATTVPVPEAMERGLSMIVMAGILWPVIHYTRNISKESGNDPTSSAGS